MTSKRPSKQNRAGDASSLVDEQGFKRGHQGRPPHQRMDAIQVEPALGQLQLL